MTPQDKLRSVVLSIDVTPKISKFMMRVDDKTQEREVTRCVKYGNFIALYSRRKVAHIPTGMLVGKPFNTNIQAVQFAKIVSRFKGWNTDDIKELEQFRGVCNTARLFVTGCRIVDSSVEALLERMGHAGTKQKSR